MFEVSWPAFQMKHPTFPLATMANYLAGGQVVMVSYLAFLPLFPASCNTAELVVQANYLAILSIVQINCLAESKSQWYNSRLEFELPYIGAF
jgi:hypothetical protein